MQDAFDDSKANFKGISQDKDLYISSAIHKSFIEVNEKGTEAAAATVVQFKNRCKSRIREEIFDFKADRPFFYYIKDENT